MDPADGRRTRARRLRRRGNARKPSRLCRDRLVGFSCRCRQTLSARRRLTGRGRGIVPAMTEATSNDCNAGYRWIAQRVRVNGPRGTRTLTPFRAMDFESIASANSARGPTAVLCESILVRAGRQRRRRQRWARRGGLASAARMQVRPRRHAGSGMVAMNPCVPVALTYEPTTRRPSMPLALVSLPPG